MSAALPGRPSRRRHSRLVPALVLSLLGVGLTGVGGVAPLASASSSVDAAQTASVTADESAAESPAEPPPASKKVVPSGSVDTGFPAGTIIVDMGATQTRSSALKPYGFVYELLTTYKVPVSWAIKNGKSSRGAEDFRLSNLTNLSTNSTVNNKTFAGSSFVVSGLFVNEIPASRLTYWRGQGVSMFRTNAAVTLPEFSELRSWPRIVLDADSSAVADEYYDNAGIPNSAYRVALPSALTPCDDLFVFPHAVPTWAKHSNLKAFNDAGGHIFAQCYSPSWLENIDDPNDSDSAPDLNFLSTTGLRLWYEHSAGRPPYTYLGNWSHPTQQYMDTFDAATTYGYESVYLPRPGGAWRPTSQVLVTDADHPQGSSSNPAAVTVTGRGFGKESNGLVMYQGGHSYNGSSGTTATADVAAQRAFLNFNLQAGIDRGITATTNVPNGEITGGAKIPVLANATGGSGSYTYAWTSSCGGSFANSTAATTTFTAPTVLSSTDCTLRVTVTDSCGRVAFAASAVPVQQSADLSITKVEAADPIRAGDAVTYTITATNSSTTLDAASVVVTDVLDRNTTLLSTTPSSCTNATSNGITTVTCALGTLPKQTSQTITIRTTSSVFTGADTFAGSGAHPGGAGATCPTSDLCNSVSITSTTRDPDPTNNGFHQPTNVVRPGITLAKAVTDSNDPDTEGTLGETLTYTFTVTNTGVLPLSNVKITDARLGLSNASCVASLLPGASSTCPQLAAQTYVVKAADITTGSITNTATATATPTLGADVTSMSTAVIQTPAAPAVRLSKTVADSSSDTDTVASFGERLTYGFSVTNTGNVPLTNVTITDPMVGLSGAACVATLAVGATSTCPSLTVPGYTTTALDVENGEVRNAATASASAPGGGTATGSGTAVIATEVARTSISMTKRVTDPSDDGLAQLGERLTYKFTITNTGNVPLSNVTVTDAMLGVDKAVCAETLAVGLSTTCLGIPTPSYVVKGADVEKGSIDNTASAAARTAKGGTVTASAAATIPAPAFPAVALTKSVTDAGGDSQGELGEKLTYAFSVTNTGNVALSGVTISDPMLGLDRAACVATLAAGATTTCPALTVPTHTVTAADVERGEVPNTATVTGTSGKGVAVRGTATATIPVPSNPGVSVLKSVKDADKDGIASFKENLTFGFTVVNTGNVPLTDVTLTDKLLDLKDAACVASLPVGESTSCPDLTVPTYKTTDDDVDEETVVNSVSVAASSTAGPVSDSAKVSIPTESDKPGVGLTKTVIDADGDGVASLGEKLTYEFTVSNTGNVKLRQVSISDKMLDLDEADCTKNLRAEKSTTCSVTGTYRVTAEDIDSGRVKNTATVRAKSKKKEISEKATVFIDAPAAPGVTLVKTVEDSDDLDVVGSLGETLTYTFTVTNTGNTTLSSVTLTDPLLGLDGAACKGSLAPGETTTCPQLASTTHQVGAADVNRGRVDNTATVSAKPGTGGTVSSTSSASIATPAMPALALTKTVTDSADADSVGSLGENLGYVFTVTNPGNVVVGDVRISDPLLGLTSAPCVTSVAPGATVTCTAPVPAHKVTAADVARGSVDNTATATGTGADGTALNSTHSASIPTEGARPGVAILKTVTDSDDPDSTGGLGEKLTYAFEVSNTGNVDLTALTVTDAKLGLTRAPCVSSLAPGATASCVIPVTNRQHTVTAADLDKGTVDNTAEVSATAPGGTTVTDRGSASMPTPASPRLELVKTVRDSDDADSVASLGEKLSYGFTVTNSGDVPLSNVTVTDAKLGLKDAACVGSLAVGATSTCPQLSAPTYTTTLADLQAGTVENTATASGRASSGGSTSVDASTSIPTVSPLPAVGLSKSVADSADADSVASSGERLTYSFTVTNNGNVPLTDVRVSDSRLGLTDAACVATLAVGASSACPQLTVPAYTVTVADVANGKVVNTATATAAGPGGGSVTGTGTATMATETSRVSLALVKTVRDSGDPDTSASLGETLTYGFQVTNNGNVALSGITVTDAKLNLTEAACVANLAPGATATCSTTATYQTQASDLAAGTVENTASAKGTGNGQTVSASASVKIPTQETGVPPAPPSQGFNYDWQYPGPTCDALTVTYPADLPQGQSNDVNIRFRDDQNRQFTLNFHNNEFFWSGTTSFVYRDHPNWPKGLTRWTVEWTQVAGTNYHWEGAVSCQLVDGGTRAVGVTSIDGWRTSTATVPRGRSASSQAVTVNQPGTQPVILEKEVGGVWTYVSTTPSVSGGKTLIAFPQEGSKGTFAYRLRIVESERASGFVTNAFTVKVV